MTTIAVETVSTKGPYGPLSMTSSRPVLMRIRALAIALASFAGALASAPLGALLMSLISALWAFVLKSVHYGPTPY